MWAKRLSVIGSLLLAANSLMVSGCKREVAAAAPVAPPEVTVSKPVERDITDFLEFTGRSESPEIVQIRARVSGYLDTIHFKDGQEVKKGDALFDIDPRPFDASLGQANAELARSEAVLAQAVSQTKRYEDLRKTNAVSQQDLEKAIADKGAAEAAKVAANELITKAKLDVEFAKIRAPITGRASRTNISVGNLISPTADPSGVLTTIVSVDPMYVYFNIDEQALLRYKEVLKKSGKLLKLTHVKELQLPVSIALMNEAGFTHKGTLDFLDNQVATTTGTIRARASVANADRSFLPGLFVRVRLPIGDSHKELMVLDRAIGTDQNLRYVLVVNEKDEVERRDVTLGSLHDGERAITSGITASDWVIVNGTQRARPGATVKPQKK